MRERPFQKYSSSWETQSAMRRVWALWGSWKCVMQLSTAVMKAITDLCLDLGSDKRAGFTWKVWLLKPLSQPCDTVCHMSDYSSELSCPSELLSRTELSVSHWSSRGLASERTYTTLATLWLNPNFRGWSSVNYSIVLSLNAMILRQNLKLEETLNST